MSDGGILVRAADRVQAWFGQAWPLWIAGGCDPGTGLFHEQLGFEWSWLLHRWAVSHGLDRDGLVIDECDRLGRSRRRSGRTWPQTELIKSHLANDAPDQAARVTIAVLDRYLATDVAGLWIDQFDADGRPATDTVPASTLYHLVVAFEEVLRAAGRTIERPAARR